MNQGVPKVWKYLMKGFLSPLLPVLKYALPVRSINAAATDLIEISVGKDRNGESGYYTMSKKDTSSPESNDEEKQKKLWAKSLEWAKITQGETALKTAFQ